MQGRILSECLKAGECNARFQDLVSHEQCLQAANLFSAVVSLQFCATFVPVSALPQYLAVNRQCMCPRVPIMQHVATWHTVSFYSISFLPSEPRHPRHLHSHRQNI